MKKKLILVASPPACGKTYVSELISKALGHIVYLDKDDLADLLRCSFSLCGEPLDMDGKFYIENLRPSEYASFIRIALSALRFEDSVILNAPFGKEVRDTEYMRELKDKANGLGAELILVWVTAPPEVCYARMKKRNSDRDALKLQNWDEYVKTVNYRAPKELESKGAVDRLIIFDSTDDASVEASLAKTLEIIKK